MGKVENLETLKEPPLTEVWALERSQNMNKSREISLTLGEYPGVIPSTNFVQPRNQLRCEWSLLILPIIQ
jgi:hypothetical protein